jgi:hypothetical protein
MIFEDQLAASKRTRSGRHQGAGDRLRAAGRRPRGRARAGHHHRRRLSLLRHRQAQVHRRRHAGARAVHPQHGDRRLHRRPRGDPDRRAQGRADADPPPQLSRVTCSASATSCSRSTRWISSTTARPASTRSSRTTAPSPTRSGSKSSSADPDLRLQGRQHHHELGEHAVVHRPDADRASRDGRTRPDGRRRAVPHAGAVGEPPEPRFPRLLRHSSPPAR